ncbi:MAG: Trk family potassium uptake protein [bacterium]|nr:Trk family potassium uptake protein [bacterium]
MNKNENPAIKLIAGFLSIIFIGASLLSFSFMRQPDIAYSFVDTLFTAFSSVCVTGLTTVNIGTYFTFPGQLVILFLIQIGGLGYMTIAVLMLALIKKRLSISQKLATQSSIGRLSMDDLMGFVKYVILITLVIETIGAVLLSYFWYPLLGSKSIYFAIFHAISAFCNAGFSLFSTGLLLFSDHISTILVMSFLIILGGIGFVVLYDLINYRKFKKISYHSKFVLYFSLYFILLPFIMFFIMEYSNTATIGNFPLFSKILTSFFHSVTARTAGFNIVSVNNYTNFNLFLCMILMFIGASPAGTGGGIKTTTFVTVLCSFKAMFKGEKHVSIFYRRLEDKIIERAWVLFFSALIIIAVFTLTLMLVENCSFKSGLFEIVSAFGTVGLSCGITEDLSNCSKILLMVLMLTGRIAPLLIVSGFFVNYKGLNYKYPEEKIIIG